MHEWKLIARRQTLLRSQLQVQPTIVSWYASEVFYQRSCHSSQRRISEFREYRIPDCYVSVDRNKGEMAAHTPDRKIHFP